MKVAEEEKSNKIPGVCGAFGVFLIKIRAQFHYRRMLLQFV